MTAAVESTTPSAVIDRVSLVLDAFDGPGRLTLAQIVRRTGLPRSSAHRMLERLVQLRWLRTPGQDLNAMWAECEDALFPLPMWEGYR